MAPLHTQKGFHRFDNIVAENITSVCFDCIVVIRVKLNYISSGKEKVLAKKVKATVYTYVTLYSVRNSVFSM